MTVKQATPLNGHHQRKQRSNQATHVNERANLPDAATFAAAGAPPALVTAVQTWQDLKTAERDQARLAAAANAKAEAATVDFRAKVREALAAGEDPAKVKDHTATHKATAAAHLGFHNDAINERARLGVSLGLDIEVAAPAMYPAVEERIEDAAAGVRGSLAAVRESWASYSEAFELRRWLSHAARDGGSIGAFHGASALPAEVATALATLDRAIGELDRLKEDEAEQDRWRAAQA